MGRIGLISVAILGLAVVACPFVGVREDTQWIDAVTGSTRRQTVWTFGITRGPSVGPSPLETRLRDKGIGWSADWRFVSETQRTLLGTAISRGCGIAPPIYQIRSMLGEFVSVSSDDDLWEFVRVMQSGGDEEQRAAVNAAVEQVLRRPATSSY